MPGKKQDKKSGIKRTGEFANDNIGIGTGCPGCLALIDCAAGKVEIMKARPFRRNKNPEALIIDGSGRVGIGSATPYVKSDIG